MSGLGYLTWRYLATHRTTALLLAGSLGLVLFLPVASTWLTARFSAALTERADATPLVAGAPGSALDLVLEGLFFRSTDLPPITAAFWDELAADTDVLAVPVHSRDTARGRPIVATAPEYFEQRGLELAAGEWPLILGECVLGHEVARELGLAPGDRLFSDPRELYDLTKPQAVALRVVGTLARARSADDRAVFTDTKTGWVLDGLYHGHEDVDETTDPRLVLGETDQGTVLSPALLSYHEVTPENAASYHLHATRDELPLSLVLVFPDTQKAATLIENRVNVRESHQVVRARSEVDELLGQVVRVQSLVRSVSLVLGLGTLALGVLVAALSSRLREAEWRALDRLGAPASSAVLLQGSFLALVLLAALAAALAGWFALTVAIPDPTRLL